MFRKFSKEFFRKFSKEFFISIAVTFRSAPIFDARFIHCSYIQKCSNIWCKADWPKIDIFREIPKLHVLCLRLEFELEFGRRPASLKNCVVYRYYIGNKDEHIVGVTFRNPPKFCCKVACYITWKVPKSSDICIAIGIGNVQIPPNFAAIGCVLYSFKSSKKFRHLYCYRYRLHSNPPKFCCSKLCVK